MAKFIVAWTLAVCIWCGIASTTADREGDIRLSDGSSTHEGRVEIYHNDVWGTVCGNRWTSNEAAVVCRQLGYQGVSVTYAFYGSGSGPIHLDHVTCEGHESRLTDCLHNDWGAHDCSHYQDVGVQCLQPSYTSTVSPNRETSTVHSAPPASSQMASWIIAVILTVVVVLTCFVIITMCICWTQKNAMVKASTTRGISGNSLTTTPTVPADETIVGVRYHAAEPEVRIEEPPPSYCDVMRETYAHRGGGIHPSHGVTDFQYPPR